MPNPNPTHPRPLGVDPSAAEPALAGLRPESIPELVEAVESLVATLVILDAMDEERTPWGDDLDALRSALRRVKGEE